MQATARRIFAGLIAGVAALATAPAAWASISPTLTLDQSGGTNSGGTVPLGMDLHFSPSGGDSPKDMTLTLPPGLASDASIDGGACLRSTAPIAPCQVGTGTVTVVPAGSLAITF